MHRISMIILSMGFIVFMSGCSVMKAVNPFPQHIFSSAPSHNSKNPSRAYAPKTRPYRVMGVTYYPLQSAQGYDEVGMASWYGKDFHGKKTACGEVYNMYGLSAAHKTLPLGTRIRVTNLANGRSVYLTVNDRGPFVKGRILDLSYGAAKELGTISHGVARVRITAVGTIPAHDPAQTIVASRSDQYHVRVGAFSDHSNASKMYRQLRAAGYEHSRVRVVNSGGRTLHVVQAGTYSSREQALRVLARLQSAFPSSYITT